eukprot:CAMPEP_0196820534 /NCGR_PEP_ID=MMETSP1362-20130617/75762_1 /TAXON_ID=163516 /ORGANISM="Leptocylindrus danicus, Strain CCMP1856" /LENGTH=86 /DNA_ID=CAMNT_0042199463 /DNA_START=202 /DNA_END=462 /DNA_ORIENTATION=-
MTSGRKEPDPSMASIAQSPIIARDPTICSTQCRLSRARSRQIYLDVHEDNKTSKFPSISLRMPRQNFLTDIGDQSKVVLPSLCSLA